MQSIPFYKLPFPKDVDLAELYHENTKYHPYVARTAEEIRSAPAHYPPAASLQYVPQGREGRIPLPDPSTLPEVAVSVEAAIRARRSRRDFSGAPITLAQLSKILFLTYGYTGPLEVGGAPGRAAPSAGARYPLELYPVVHNVEGLAKGVYHYHPESHSLEPVEIRDLDAQVRADLFEQEFIPDGAFTLLVGAVFSRNMVKYQERGYRLVLLDAGHAMENLYLVAVAMGLGVSGLGGFLDDNLSRLVKLNCEDENVVYAVSVGVRRG